MCTRISCPRSTSSRVVPQSGQTRVTKPSSSDAKIRKSNGPSAAEHLGSRHRNQFVDTNVSVWASVAETSCSGCVRNLIGALHAARKLLNQGFAPAKCPARSNACNNDMRRRNKTDRRFPNKCRRLLMPKCQDGPKNYRRCGTKQTTQTHLRNKSGGGVQGGLDQ